MKDIILTVNGLELKGHEGMTILEVARENGIEIPTLCYRQELSPIGACRVCVVEVEGSRTLVGSCHTPVSQGMKIQTHSPKVIEARRLIVELLLSSHCGFCFVCRKANICELRKLAADLEIGIPRFTVRKRYYPIEDVSPYVRRDLSQCVLCRRCIRSCAEIKKAGLFGAAYRGFDSKIVVDCDRPIENEICRDCDVCISLCPTGALTKNGELTFGKNGKPLVITN